VFPDEESVLVTRGNECPEERIPLYKPECEACADGFISAHEKATNEIRAIKDTEHSRLVEVARSAGKSDGYKEGLEECQSRMEEIKREIEERFFTFDGDGNQILYSVMDNKREVNWWQGFWKWKGIK